MDILATCLLGVGVVFAGLICIIVLCYIMSSICRATEKPQKAVEAAPAPAAVQAPIQNKQEMVAAIAASIAEDLGTDVSALRILSIKKI